ncbi:MAG: TnpV protein [Selenomonas sp.]|nr:TnpV protein [Selenomonas sp.]
MSEQPIRTFGRWSALKLRFLEENHPLMLQAMMEGGTLEEYLMDVEEESSLVYQRIVDGLRKKWGVPEFVRPGMNQMEWLGQMNAVRMSASEMTQQVVCSQ